MRVFIKVLFLSVFILSCSQRPNKKNKIKENVYLNDLTVTDKEIYLDSINLASKSHKKNGIIIEDFKLDFAIVRNTLTDSTNSYEYKNSCFITIMPDNKVIDKMQNKIGEEYWDVIVDDNLYYESLAIDDLSLKGIKQESSSRNKRYLLFIKENGSKIILDQKKLLNSWGFILFNGNDIPIFWSGTDISQTIEKVFK